MEQLKKKIDDHINRARSLIEHIMWTVQTFHDSYENMIEGAFEELAQPDMYIIAKALLNKEKEAGNPNDWDIEFLSFELEEWHKGI